MKQIRILLNILESRLLNLQQTLLKLNSRKGMLHFGGTILQTMFESATVTVLHMLHEMLEGLKSKDTVIAHSLANYIKYVTYLDHSIRVNSDAISNLSTFLKLNDSVA
jgi:hypothetical protein